MHCLFNYIGIKNCSTNPFSGRYVNELPGMSSELIKSYVNGDEVTTQEKFKNIQNIAFDKLFEDVHELLSSKYKLKSVIDCGVAEVAETDDLLDADQFYPVKVASEIDSQFLTIGFHSMRIYASQDGKLTYKLSGVETEVDVVEGWNDIAFDEFVQIEKTFSLEVKGNLVKGIQSCGGDIAVVSQVAINLDLSVMCDLSGVICRNKKSFLRAWQYLLGYQIVVSGKGSSNINMFTTILKDETIDLEKLYLDNYERSLSKTLKGLVIDTHDFCVSCNNKIVRKYYLP